MGRILLLRSALACYGASETLTIAPMGSEKRARQKQNRQARLEEERRAAQRAKWRRRITTGLVLVAILVVVFVVGNLLTGDSGAGVASTTVPAITDTTAAPGGP